jgi:DNA recombination protein RmuC
MILLVVVLALEIILLVTTRNTGEKEKIMSNLDELKKDQRELRVEVIKEISEGHGKNQTTIRESLIQLQESTEKRLREDSTNVNQSIIKGLQSIQEATDKKLSDIQHNMDEKLDKNLHTRLDESFKQVGERLESLYRSLGELKSLESGVISLNKTLSNVKARGVYGEMALENLLASILDKNQYDVNVATRPKSAERVEFAVKIPDKENRGFIYLPIDSKFPADIYGKVLESAENADVENLKIAIQELKMRIRKEAMTIRDKYIAPPNTTDFAIMLLPTEGLYSEVLRIDGLVEECQEKYKIVISGPTTLTATLNSLSVGFKYLTVNKKSEEIMKTLGNFKVQFEKFNDLITKTQTKISDAQKVAGQLMDRSALIQKRLDKVEVVEYEELDIDMD